MFILVKGSSRKGKAGKTQTDCQCQGLPQLEKLKHKGKVYSMEYIVALSENNISRKVQHLGFQKNSWSSVRVPASAETLKQRQLSLMGL